MAENWQTIAALGVVAIAVVYLVGLAWGKRTKPGCGGDCGCPADKLKGGLKK